MNFHHIKNAIGVEDDHWYVDLKVSNTKKIRNMLIDTGASISTLNVKSIARLYGQKESDIIQYLSQADIIDRVEKFTAIKDSVILYGVYLRNVTLGDTDLEAFKVYTRLDGYVGNLVGMDLLSACHIDIEYGKTAHAKLDVERYAPMIEEAVEIKSLTD